MTMSDSLAGSACPVVLTSSRRHSAATRQFGGRFGSYPWRREQPRRVERGSDDAFASGKRTFAEVTRERGSEGRRASITAALGNLSNG